MPLDRTDPRLDSLVTAFGRQMALRQWNVADEAAVPLEVILHRLDHGVPAEAAIGTRCTVATMLACGAVPRSRLWGVTYSRGKDKWQAQINLDGRIVVLGYFPPDPTGEIEAGRAFDKATHERNGRLVRLNFPREW